MLGHLLLLLCLLITGIELPALFPFQRGNTLNLFECHPEYMCQGIAGRLGNIIDGHVSGIKQLAGMVNTLQGLSRLLDLLSKFAAVLLSRADNMPEQLQNFS